MLNAAKVMGRVFRCVTSNPRWRKFGQSAPRWSRSQRIADRSDTEAYRSRLRILIFNEP